MRRETAFLLLALFAVPCAGASWGAGPVKWRSPCKVIHPGDAAVEWECRRLGKGETLEKLFGDRWKDVARFNRIDRRHARPGLSLKVPVDPGKIAGYTPMPATYPAAAEEEKFVLVDLSEQFLGAYEFGRLVFSAPVTTGEAGNATPTGEFRITAYHRHHPSTLYAIDNTDIPYPMTYALLFHVDPSGISYWIHGRDMPGYPASHGCVGLYDEEMQKKHRRAPRNPQLDDARILFEWAISPRRDDGRYRMLDPGLRLHIIGETPR